MTNLYEVLFIVPTNISEEDFSELSTKLKDTIENKHSSEIVKFEKWAERKLAYTIDNNQNGTYYILETKCTPDGIKEVEAILSFEKTKVLRFLIDKI
jgi:small subunit ribosomal protein S6